MSSLKKLAINPTGDFTVRDARGDVVEENGQPWTITVHSPGTKEFQKAKHDFDQKRSTSTVALMTGKDVKRTPEDEAREVAEFLAAVTISFNGFDYEGKVGHAAYVKAYSDIEIGHVADGLNKYLGDRANFLPPKPSDSSNSSDTQLG